MEEYLTTFGKFKIWKNDLVIISSLKQGKVYDEDIITNKLKPYIENSEYILDIGAHIGSHCISYSKINPSAEIIAFEPQNKIFELLKLNCMENECKNIKIYNNCVGHILTELELNNTIENELNENLISKNPIEYGTDTDFNMGGISIGKGGEKCQMITIDSLDLQGCDFIKIDVEGFEASVIYGCYNTIEKFKPAIYFECNNKSISEDFYNKYKPSIYYCFFNPFHILLENNYIIHKIDTFNYLALHMQWIKCEYK